LRHFLLGYFFICLLNPVIAQDIIPEFGKITIDELTMKDCAFEKAANAMNLVNQAKISFGYNDFTNVSSIKTEYSVRIKIFNKLGFSVANIKIPYISNSRYSNVTDVEAYIYSLDSTGKILKEKLGRKDILNGKTKEKDEQNYIAFTFPNLKPGAIIEYRYTRVNKNTRFIMPWFFQDLIPTAVSKVTAVVPTYRYITYYVSASNPVIKDSSYRKYEGGSYDKETHSFTMRNIHSFRIEPLMTSVKDNLERVEFSISRNGFIDRQLTDVAKKMRFYNYDLLDDWSFGFQIEKPIRSLDRFMDSVKRLTRKVDRIDAIYQLVKKNIEWNGDQSFFCDDSVDGCWNSKTGSSAEMNVLLLNLLRKADIKCFPLLVSTHENGSPDMDFASLSQFNGVDVLVIDSGTKYILDCTQKYLSFRIPPYNILNSNGYIVDHDGMGWMFIMDHRILMKTETYVNATIDSTGFVKGTAKTSFVSFAESERLKELKEKKDYNRSVESDLLNNDATLVSDTVTTEHLEDDSLVEKQIFHFKSTSTDKFYFLNPFMFSVFSKNPFIENVRYSDIDFGSNQSFVTEILIKMTPNISIESLPKDIALYKNDSTIFFVRTVITGSNYILIRNNYVIKKAIFIKEDYANLKSFFDKFYSLLNENIIVKKN
jgi:Domain of Unknown Function with PDB structure (DUF3857)